MSINKLQDIFREVFADDQLVLTPELSAKDVEGWDSFNHINLVVAIETEYGVQFATQEIAALNDVDGMVKLMRSKNIDISF